MGHTVLPHHDPAAEASIAQLVRAQEEVSCNAGKTTHTLVHRERGWTTSSNWKHAAAALAAAGASKTVLAPGRRQAEREAHGRFQKTLVRSLESHLSCLLYASVPSLEFTLGEKPTLGLWCGLALASMLLLQGRVVILYCLARPMYKPS